MEVLAYGLEFGVWGLGFKVWVWGPGVRYESPGLRLKSWRGHMKVDIRIPGKGNSNSHGAGPVYYNHLND